MNVVVYKGIYYYKSILCKRGGGVEKGIWVIVYKLIIILYVNSFIIYKVVEIILNMEKI